MRRKLKILGEVFNLLLLSSSDCDRMCKNPSAESVRLLYFLLFSDFFVLLCDSFHFASSFSDKILLQSRFIFIGFLSITRWSESLRVCKKKEKENKRNNTVQKTCTFTQSGMTQRHLVLVVLQILKNPATFYVASFVGFSQIIVSVGVSHIMMFPHFVTPTFRRQIELFTSLLHNTNSSRTARNLNGNTMISLENGTLD